MKKAKHARQTMLRISSFTARCVLTVALVVGLAPGLALAAPEPQAAPEASLAQPAADGAAAEPTATPDTPVPTVDNEADVLGVAPVADAPAAQDPSEPATANELSPQAVTLDTPTFSGGNGSSANPYLISNAADFVALSQAVAAEQSFANTSFKLTADVDLSNTDFAPIGDYTGSTKKPFAGSFDGAGHSVKLALNVSGKSGVGLFGYLAGANSSVPARVSNLTITGSVMGTNSSGGGTLVGAIAGIGKNAQIENCVNEASISGYQYVGGIVGANATSYNDSDFAYLSVTNCANKGYVEGNWRYGPTTAGGIIGLFGPTERPSVVSTCYNTGRVRGDNLTGGIVGRACAIYQNGSNYSWAIEKCFGTGTVGNYSSSNTPSNINALIGSVETTSGGNVRTIEKCYAAEDSCVVNGTTKDSLFGYVSPEMVSESEFKTPEFMKSYDFVELMGSAFIQDDGFPILRIEKPNAPVIGRLVASGIDSLSRCVIGHNVVLQANASSPVAGGALSYAWYKSTDETLDPAGDVKLSSTTTQLTTTESSPCTVYYYCLVTNTVNGATTSIKSAPVKVIYHEAIAIATPTITSQPADGQADQDGAAYVLSVGVNSTATGIGELSYQWYRCTSASSKSDATAIEGATSATYNAPTDYANTYYYYCTVTNTFNVETTQTDTRIATVTINPTIINTAADLMALSERVSGYSSPTYTEETLEGKTFVLGADINLSGTGFRPIGSRATYTGGSSSTHKFKGTFDGAGHSITGLNIVYSTTNQFYKGYNGLFGYVEGATIKNLRVTGNVSDPDNPYVGGIVGYAGVDCVFENLSFEGNVSGSSRVGGIVGSFQGSSDGMAVMSNCLSRATVTAASVAGGIAGAASSAHITACYNWGNVTVNNQSGYGGGITGSAGYFQGSNNVSIDACYNIGTVKNNYPSSFGAAPYVGPISGDGFASSTLPNYSLTGSAAEQQNAPAGSVVIKSDAEMRAANFVTLLNTGLTPAAYMRNVTGGYPLLSWESQGSVAQLTLTITPAAAADATVTVTDANGTPAFALVDPTLDANKRVYSLLQGTYTIKATCYGYEDFTQTVVIDGSGDAQSLSVQMQPSAASTVTFALSTDDGASTSGARLWLKSDKYGWIHQGDAISSISEFNTSTGAYANIPQGTYSYGFVLDGHQSVKGSFTVGSTGQAVSQTVAFASPTAWDGTSAEPLRAADGIFIVTNGSELAWMSDYVAAGRANADNGAGEANIEVIADILLSGNGAMNQWKPIGTSQWPYVGTFDAHGHVISGMYMDVTTSYIGLFGIATDAVFKNAIVAGSLRTTAQNAGGLVAFIRGNAVIQNVGNHTNVEAASYVGGIVGSVDTTGTQHLVQISQCYNKGDLRAAEQDWHSNNNIGGICGEARQSNYDSFRITSCYNLGRVDGGAVGAGGILGTGGVELSHCFNAGEVILGTYAEVYQNCSGALIGWPPENGLQVSVNNVYYLEGSSPRAYGYVNAVPAYSATKFGSAAELGTNPASKGLLGYVAPSAGFNGGYPALSWESADVTIPANPGLIGSEDNPYIIQTADELIAFSNAVKAGNTYADRYVELRADIDLGSRARDFSPIGDYDGRHAFEGHFKGNGHAIKGLSINGGTGVGLFGYTRHASISMVEVTGTISGSSWVGGIVGYAYDSHVTNCLSRVNVSAASDSEFEGNYAAGVVGQSYSSGVGAGSVVSCVYYGTVTHPENKLWGAITTLGTSNSTITANYYLSTQNTQGTEKVKLDADGTTGVPTFDDKVISWYLNTADGTIENTLIWGNKAGAGVQFANGVDVIATYRILMDQTAAFITANPEFVVKGETSSVTIQQVKKGYTLTGSAKVRYSGNKEPERSISFAAGSLPYSFQLVTGDADMYVSTDYSFDYNTLFDLKANVVDAAGNAFASGAQIVFLDAAGREITQAKYGEKVIALIKTIDANSQYRDAYAQKHYGSGAYQSLEALSSDMIAYGRAFEFTVGDADVDFTLALEPKGTPPTQTDDTLTIESSQFHTGDARYATGNYLDRAFIVDGDYASGVVDVVYDVFNDGYASQDVSTVESIENAPLAMRYSQHYSFLDAQGTRSSGVYTGINIGAYLVRYCTLNGDLPDSTRVTFVNSDGRTVSLTVGELRNAQRNSYCISDEEHGYAKAGDFTARGVPVMLAASKDGEPFSFEQGGPLKLIVGQKNFDDVNAGYVLDDVRKIVVGNDATLDTSMHDEAPFNSHLDEYVLIDVYRNDELVEEGVQLTLREIEDYMKANPAAHESTWSSAVRYQDGGVWSGYGNEVDHYQGVNIWAMLQDKLDLTEYDLAYEDATATFCEQPYKSSREYTPVVTTSLRYLAGGENGDYAGNQVTVSGRVSTGVPAQLATSKNGLPLTGQSVDRGTVSDANNFRGPILAMIPVNPAEGVVQTEEVIAGGYSADAYAVTFLGKIILNLGEAADKGPLQELHDTASSFTNVTVSTDGSGTADDELWIDPFSMQLLKEALANAQSVLDDNKADKAAVDAAYLQLNTAFDSFVMALQYGSALTPASLSLSETSFMAARLSNGEVRSAKALSSKLTYAGDGDIKVWATDPNVAEASYDAATGMVTVTPKGAGTTTINVFAAPSDTYAGAGAKISIDVAAVRFKGGALRVDYPDDVTKTSLRMGYEIGLPDGYEATWQWKCYTEGGADSAKVVNGEYYYPGKNGYDISNVVFTNIGVANYDLPLFSQMSLVITKNGGPVLNVDDVAHERSVDEVARAVIASDKEAASAKDYAQKILDVPRS